MMDIKSEIYRKWKESGILDGLESMTTGSIAKLLECEASKLLREEWEEEIDSLYEHQAGESY